jgi:hypothetical protein
MVVHELHVNERTMLKVASLTGSSRSTTFRLEMTQVDSDATASPNMVYSKRKSPVSSTSRIIRMLYVVVTLFMGSHFASDMTLVDFENFFQTS